MAKNPAVSESNRRRAIDPVSRIKKDAVTGCWVWMGARKPSGYGKFGREGKYIAAHRWFYERARGPIPAKMVLDHLCRNPPCVNPDHLEAVTNAENGRRGIHAKINMDIARQIRAEYVPWNRAHSMNALAAKYGLCSASVSWIVTGKGWT